MNEEEHKNKTVLRVMDSVRKAARLSSRAYLREARYGSDSRVTSNLEAIAIKRAILADTIDEIARERFGTLSNTASLRAEKDEHIAVDTADDDLLRACGRLYRACEDQEVRAFARDLRKSVAGLGCNAYSRNHLEWDN
jgi:hypothetical protein